MVRVGINVMIFGVSGFGNFKVVEVVYLLLDVFLVVF